VGLPRDVFVRASYVGITGIAIELCSRTAMTSVHTALAQLQARYPT
jgi:hypothetical protein